MSGFAPARPGDLAIVRTRHSYDRAQVAGGGRVEYDRFSLGRVVSVHSGKDGRHQKGLVRTVQLRGGERARPRPGTVHVVRQEELACPAYVVAGFSPADLRTRRAVQDFVAAFLADPEVVPWPNGLGHDVGRRGGPHPHQVAEFGGRMRAVVVLDGEPWRAGEGEAGESPADLVRRAAAEGVVP